MLRATASGPASANAARTRSPSETRPRTTGIRWTRHPPRVTTSMSRLPLLDQLEDLRAILDLLQLVLPDHGGALQGRPRYPPLDEQHGVALDDPREVRDDARLLVRPLPRARDPGQEDDLAVLRERLERALHGRQHVVPQAGQPPEDVPLEPFELLESREQVRHPRGVEERVHRDDEWLAEVLLQPEGDVDRRGHPVEVHLDRSAGDARDLREGPEGDLLLLPRAPEGLAVELHIQASGRGEDERRDALLEEVLERLAGQDRDAGPGIDDPVLERARTGPLADQEGRPLQGRRDHPELLRPLLRERVHVQEHLHEEEDLVPPRDDVEREAAGVRLVAEVEPGLREDQPHLVEEPLPIHGRTSRLGVYKMCAHAPTPQSFIPGPRIAPRDAGRFPGGQGDRGGPRGGVRAPQPGLLRRAPRRGRRLPHPPRGRVPRGDGPPRGPPRPR